MKCGPCGTQNPEGASYCLACGSHMATGAPRRDQAQESSVAKLRAAVERMVAARIAAEARIPEPVLAAVSTGMADRPVVRNDFCLVFLHHDGSDGTSYRLRGDQIDIGRTEGDLLFEDPYLSPRHARIVSGPAGQVLSHLESRNGIYIRLRAGARLKDGDLMLVGRQVLLFELVPAFERDLRPAVHHNVVQFGSTGDPSWGRLRQMGPGGVAHDVFYLNREQVVIGREEGDIVFADDHFMSRRHAHISLRGNDPQLEDLGSSNGTFLRLRGPHGLNSGDLIRMGDELLRFEIG